MEIGDAFRSRIEGRIGETIEKYFDGGFSGHVTVEKSGPRFSAIASFFLDTGMALQATGQAQEPVSAFEAAADRIEKRLRRYKRQLKSHYDGANGGGSDRHRLRVMAPVSDDEDDDVPEDYAPAIVAESTVVLKTMSVARAIIELDTKDSPVFVFRNAGNDHVNIVYRRPTAISAGSTRP